MGDNWMTKFLYCMPLTLGARLSLAYLIIYAILNVVLYFELLEGMPKPHYTVVFGYGGLGLYAMVCWFKIDAKQGQPLIVLSAFYGFITALWSYLILNETGLYVNINFIPMSWKLILLTFSGINFYLAITIASKGIKLINKHESEGYSKIENA